MPTTYQTADQSVTSLVKAVLNQFHRELVEVKLTVNVLMATPEKDEHGEPVRPALKHHGWPAAAIVKINSLQDRVEGKDDVTIRIDADWWEAHNDAERRALLDHEMAHVIVKRDKDEQVVADDVGRPKLKMRPHDYEITSFHDVAKRHGTNSCEVQGAMVFAKSPTGQLLMWG